MLCSIFVIRCSWSSIFAVSVSICTQSGFRQRQRQHVEVTHLSFALVIHFNDVSVGGHVHLELFPPLVQVGPPLIRRLRREFASLRIYMWR